MYCVDSVILKSTESFTVDPKEEFELELTLLK